MERCECRGHFRGEVDLRKGVAPRSIDLQMLLYILHQMPDAFAGMVPGTFIMDVAKGPLNRIRTRTVSR